MNLLPEMLRNYWLLIPAILILLWIAFHFVRALTWRLFSFDKRVASMLSQKKSAEVRLGKISETLAPFLDSFPVDIEKPGTSTVFLGQPIDFVHFDPDDGVTFIEVKSGNAVLSGSQKKIKSLIERGKVNWREIKIR